MARKWPKITPEMLVELEEAGKRNEPPRDVALRLGINWKQFEANISHYQRGKDSVFIVTDAVIFETGVMAKLGVKQKFVAMYFKISWAMWERACKSHPELLHAYNHGFSSTVRTVANKLLELVEKGNVAAVIFWLKANAEMTELVRVAEGIPERERDPIPNVSDKDPSEAARIYQQVMTKD